ncbi:hypothetical protein J6590_083498 [Homalodisca vitripennis]|nr:hypothetical protein J6590_083498 [Homalodisca vitripennis]
MCKALSQSISATAKITHSGLIFETPRAMFCGFNNLDPCCDSRRSAREKPPSRVCLQAMFCGFNSFDQGSVGRRSARVNSLNRGCLLGMFCGFNSV